MSKPQKHFSDLMATKKQPDRAKKAKIQKVRKQKVLQNEVISLYE